MHEAGNSKPSRDGRSWTETPAITIEHQGFLGNGLIRFMAIHTAANTLGNCTISNFSFPEWSIHFPRVDFRSYRRNIMVDRNEDFNIEFMRRQAERDPSVNFIVRSFLQRQDFLGSPNTFREIFPVERRRAYVCGDDELLINVRTGDILQGHVPFYPLMPIGFYRDIISQTKLRPVFMGQLDPGRYVTALRDAFPDAKFMPSLGPIADFDTIRLARHIVPAVSTFSIVAAWLSEAATIYLPLNGFLNPAHMREIDLVPLGDFRYRYFLFPLNFALPEEQALEHHESISGLWKEISGSRVRALKMNAPIIRPAAERATAADAPCFDEKWYIHTYLDAARDVSDGWYQDAWQHYLDFGRGRGYAPSREVRETALPNVALHCRAWQSSLSVWSVGRTTTEDAMNAVNGDRSKELAFHTGQENRPWWAVDLAATHVIDEIHIYNRKGQRALQERAAPLLIEVSADARQWQEFARTEPGRFFGTDDGGMTPLVCRASEKCQARYVRITIAADDSILHLTEVEVYGLPV